MARIPDTHGPRHEDERAGRDFVLDTRPWLERASEVAQIGPVASGVLLALGGLELAAPALADVVALTGAAYALWVMTRPVRLPWNLPERSGRKDPNELDTVRYKPTPAAGRDYLGNERFTRREIWRTREASNQHSTYPGATGSGKTGSMSSYAIGNALAQSSGATYVCAKGDKGVFEDAFAKAFEAGREDDVLLFSALGGESNTINQFADASANMIKETLVGLVNEPDPGSNGALFFGRMVAFIETIAPIARWIADNKGVRLDLERIRDLTELTNVVRMVQKREVKFVYAATGQEEIVDISGCPYLYIRGLESYLGETGSFDVDVSVKEQRSTAPAEQHSYVAMQLTEVFSQWLISLGHIFRVPSGDIDMADVVMQRRILVGLLPSLGSSEKTVSGLAKCLVAMLKAMMFHVLGHEIEGDYIEVNENKPSRAYAAYKVVRDEYAPQAAAGDDKMLAMSRSLNIEFLARLPGDRQRARPHGREGQRRDRQSEHHVRDAPAGSEDRAAGGRDRGQGAGRAYRAARDRERHLRRLPPSPARQHAEHEPDQLARPARPQARTGDHPLRQPAHPRELRLLQVRPAAGRPLQPAADDRAAEAGRDPPARRHIGPDQDGAADRAGNAFGSSPDVSGLAAGVVDLRRAACGRGRSAAGLAGGRAVLPPGQSGSDAGQGTPASGTHERGNGEDSQAGTPAATTLSGILRSAAEDRAAAGPFPDPGRLPKAYDQVTANFARIERLGGARGEDARKAARQVVGAYRQASRPRGPEKPDEISTAKLVTAINTLIDALDGKREGRPRLARSLLAIDRRCSARFGYAGSALRRWRRLSVGTCLPGPPR